MAQLKYRLAAAPYRAAELLRLLPRPSARVAYVVENANWSVHWDGTYIRKGIERIAPGLVELSTHPERLIDRVVHFGSQFQWLAWVDALSRSNRFVVTFFHGKREDDAEMAQHIDAFMASVPRLEKVVTACRLSEGRLLDWGVPREKLVRIPIAIDLELFRPITAQQRREARVHYKIPDDCLVIGSFQKDGKGWAEGNEPKLIKGPDVLVDVVARVSKQRRVFVLLTGPARGYVKRRLETLNIPHAHDYVENYLTLPARYAALDVYLNPSREEGGPKGILEAIASGVPAVSTKVGMAPEMIGANEAGRLLEVGDAAGLADAILELDRDAGARARVIAAGHKVVTQCNWVDVARRHYEDIYRPLIG